MLEKKYIECSDLRVKLKMFRSCFRTGLKGIIVELFKHLLRDFYSCETNYCICLPIEMIARKSMC